MRAFYGYFVSLKFDLVMLVSLRTAPKWMYFVCVVKYVNSLVTFYPLAFQAEEVLSLPASVRLSVRLSVKFTLSAR